VRAYHGKCTNPMQLVKYAEKMMSKWGIDFSEGDGLWCACDVDEHTTATIIDSYKYAKARSIDIALSNPCIELWFLLHFKHVTSPLNQHDALVQLKAHIRSYTKGKDVNEDLKSNLSAAIRRAKSLNQKYEREEIELYSRESNPSTQVFRLIEFIQSKSINTASSA